MNNHIPRDKPQLSEAFSRSHPSVWFISSISSKGTVDVLTCVHHRPWCDQTRGGRTAVWSSDKISWLIGRHKGRTFRLISWICFLTFSSAVMSQEAEKIWRITSSYCWISENDWGLDFSLGPKHCSSSAAYMDVSELIFYWTQNRKNS